MPQAQGAPNVPSYWQRTSGVPVRTRGALPRRAECVVVGGGFAGLATAIRLRETAPDLDVIVLEAQHMGFGASGRNAGFLSPVAVPIWLLGADRDPELAWALGHWRRELDRLAQAIDRWYPDAELRPSLLHLEGHSLLTDAGLVEFSRALGCAGIEHELSKSQARVGRLSLRMSAFCVHPFRLVCALAERAQQLGVRLFEGARVKGFHVAGDGVEVKIDGGETDPIRADELILCTNAYTGDLHADAQAWTLPMYSYMLASEPLRHGVTEGHFTVDLNTAETYHREHASRVLLGGADRLARRGSTNQEVPAHVRQQLVRQLKDRFPSAADISDVWSGRLLVTPTGVPRIRKSPAHHGRVVFNLGYGGTGVALTLALAKFAAAVTLGTPIDGEDARFFRVLGDTRIPLWGLVRGAARVLVSLPRARTLAST